MSWSRHYANKANFLADVLDFKTNQDENEQSVVDEQVAAARLVAKQLIESGAVGGADKDFAVSLSGHANPKHEPRENWSTDGITVSVVQKLP